MRLPSPEFIKHLIIFLLVGNLFFFGIILLSNEEREIIKEIITILALPTVISIYPILIYISKTRKATLHLKQKPKRLLGFITNQSPKKIIEQVTLIASTINYTIENIDESIGRIILSSSPNWITGWITGWGFFYPVYVSIQNDGNTLVEVGIKSRLIQGGPLVTRAHKKFYNRVKNKIKIISELENTR